MQNPLILELMATTFDKDRRREADQFSLVHRNDQRPSRQTRIALRRELGTLLMRAGSWLACEPVLVPERR